MTGDVQYLFWKEGEETEGVDIETRFEGLLYSKCEGLLTKGKRKDIYEEKYADDDKLRVWQGEKVTREATTITFTFFFVGENRLHTYQNFYDYVKNGKLYYYDAKRLKKAYMVLKEALEPQEDIYKGSTPYIKADFKFQHLWGECKDVTL
jgi:hypothetical protein